ncbi:hypothetical protein BJF91_12975 [Allorhizobium taibaishanense]|uniref:Uncharacterized protein n=1 Tax=Allorhizobium taibaishanense TaxID=887144 RepID=A0A1Q9A6L9_9HYPH|nr:hypothetical protein BJF91_12975 [Allorhizobium taibaishanense]
MPRAYRGRRHYSGRKIREAFGLQQIKRMAALTNKILPDIAATAAGTEQEAVSDALTALLTELQNQDVTPAVLELARNLENALARTNKVSPDKA